MPFITDDELLKQQQAFSQGTDPSQPTAISDGATSSITGGAAAPANPSATPASSGSYTNLQSYLDANKDQAGQLGQTVGNKIKSDGMDASNTINSSTQAFQDQVGQGTIKNLDTAATDAKNIVTGAQNVNAGQSESANDLNRFKEVSNAQYKGPNDWQSANLYQPAYDKVAKTQNESNLSQTDSGRYALLQNVFSRPTYSSGETNLDGLLLNGNSDAKAALADARTSVQGIGDQFQAAQNSGSALAAQTKGQTDTARQSALSDFNAGRDQTSNAVQSRLGDIQNHWSDKYNDLMGVLKPYNGGELDLTQDQAKTLGITDAQRLYGMLNGTDPASYLKQGTFDANKEVSHDEVARLSALDQLAAQAGLAQTNKYTDAQAQTQSLDDALDASDFGKVAQDRQSMFNDYANQTNLTGTGSDTQSFNYGPFGMHTDSVTENSVANMNLQNFLNQTAITANSDGSYSNNYGLPGVNNDITRNVLGGAVDGHGDLWSDGKGEARNAAASAADAQAKSNLYQAILDSLNSQGYANQVRIK